MFPKSALFEPYLSYLSSCKESLTQSVDPEDAILSKRAGVTNPAKITYEQWTQKQYQDPAICQVLQFYKSRKLGWYKTGPTDSNKYLTKYVV